MIGSMHGIIFAYKSNPDMRQLVDHRTPASIPYGGRYRLIDFMLSSMVNAGIGDVGVIMQDSYQSLLDHLGSGKDWDLSRRVGGLRLLPPFSLAQSGAHEYRGRMEALANLYAYLQRIRQKYVVFAEGSLVANIPLLNVLKHHIESGADITAVCTPSPGPVSGRDSYFVLRDDGFIDEVISRPGTGLQLSNKSLEVYILSTKLLLNLVEHCHDHSLYSFTIDVLQRMTGSLRIGMYMHDGYTSIMRSISDYYEGSMDLLKTEVRQNLFWESMPIRTKERADASTYYGSSSKSRNSLVADGCIIEGTVENSIVFRGVRIGRGAVIKNCILMQDTFVDDAASLEYVIADKNVRISRGVELRGHERYPITVVKGKTI